MSPPRPSALPRPRRPDRAPVAVLTLLLILWLASVPLACLFGPVPLEPGDVLHALLGTGGDAAGLSAEAARTSLLKSRQPSRATGAAQMPAGPESASPTSSPAGATQFPSSSRGVSPAPAGFTRMSVSTLGHSFTTASMVPAMSPAEVAMMALMSAPFRR